MKRLRHITLCCLATLLTACGFHLQGETTLARPLHRLYLQSPDPYGHLARNLEQGLKMSHVQLVSDPKQANAILSILSDTPSQTLLSVSGTQQVRQYNLGVTVTFEITQPDGTTVINPQTLSTTRTLTVQSNDVLGTSNEASLFYQQMRRSLAYAILNRIASRDMTHIINTHYDVKNTNGSPHESKPRTT